MKYKNAFKCKKCPETNNENGCPLWWEMVLQHDTSGEQKVEKACGYVLLPQLLVLNYKQSSHSVYAAYDMRNKVLKNVGKVISAVQTKLELPEDLILEEVEQEEPALITGEN